MVEKEGEGMESQRESPLRRILIAIDMQMMSCKQGEKKMQQSGPQRNLPLTGSLGGWICIVNSITT